MSEWTLVITPKTKWWNLQLKEILHYKDLLFLFVRRDFVAMYKQTILGPLWFVIQPLISTFVFTIVFGRIAKIPTDGVPPVLFYMTGIIAWNFFADCLNKTASTFSSNAAIFGKIYFPRIIVPFSIVFSTLIKFLIQFLLLVCFLLYYYMNGSAIFPGWSILLMPLLLLIMAGTGLGCGIIISSFAAKYRDLQYLIAFGVQLLMYATPVVYPLSLLEGNMKTLVLLNPLTPVIETFKYSFLGGDQLYLVPLSYSFAVMIFLVLIGLFIFHKVEKTFMDTV